MILRQTFFLDPNGDIFVQLYDVILNNNMCVFVAAFLTAIMKAFPVDLWIGLYNTNISPDFQWTDGSPVTYTNWAQGQPDGAVVSTISCHGTFVHTIHRAILLQTCVYTDYRD